MDIETPASVVTPAPARLRHYDELPGPRAYPIVGNALQLDSRTPHLQMQRWCDEYGPIYRMRIGKRRAMVIGDHALVAQVLRDRPEGFRRTTSLERIWAEMGMPLGLFAVNGEVWKRQRRMVMAGFDPAHVKRYFPALQQVAAALARRWQKAAQQGQAIDLQADLMRYTVDTIAGLAFGAEVNTLETEGNVLQHHLDKIFPALNRRLLSPLPTWRWWRSAADRELELGVAEVNRAVAGFIAQARSRMAAEPNRRERPENLLEAMLAAADAPGSGIDDEQVSGNVLTMLLAGEDTTANTIAWMIHLLWRHPAALERARAEVRAVVADPACPGWDEIAKLDFIEACAHETMRLKPVAPLLVVQALGDTTLADVQVPKGMVVTTVMRRDSVSDQHVPRAAAFEPERWLGAGSGAGSGAGAGEGSVAAVAGSARRISMPFGAGPRICPGRYLALLEMKMAMATLLGRFEVQSVDTPDGQIAQEKLAFAMAPVGLTMRLRAHPR
ncbi:MAG: cytochrome P450 [Methylibium sp. NZG]|nr:MAG: cytochrome P450 [Methylibium sp. NZG]